jgi:hypothetical protein
MTSYRYRSAVTGRFVSREFAEAHPSVTVRERVVAPVNEEPSRAL